MPEQFSPRRDGRARGGLRRIGGDEEFDLMEVGAQQQGVSDGGLVAIAPRAAARR